MEGEVCPFSLLHFRSDAHNRICQRPGSSPRATRQRGLMSVTVDGAATSCSRYIDNDTVHTPMSCLAYRTAA